MARAELEMQQLEARLERLRLEVAAHPQRQEQALAEATEQQSQEQERREMAEGAMEEAEEARLAEELASAQAALPRVREQVSDMCVGWIDEWLVSGGGGAGVAGGGRGAGAGPAGERRGIGCE